MTPSKLVRGCALALSVFLAAWLIWVILHAGLAPRLLLPVLLGLMVLAAVRPFLAACITIALMPSLGWVITVWGLPYFVPAEVFTYAAVSGWLLRVAVLGWQWRAMALHPWLVVWTVLVGAAVAVEMKALAWGADAAPTLVQRVPDVFTGYDRRSLLYPMRAGFTLLSGVVGFVFISQCVRTSAERIRALTTVLWVGVGVSAYAVFQFVTGTDLHMGVSVHSTLRDEGSLGAYLVLIFGIALGCQGSPGLGVRRAAVLAMTACGAGLLCSQSRTSWLAALALVAAQVYRWLGRERGWSHAKRVAAFSSLAVVAVATGVSIARHLDVQEKYGSVASPLWHALNPNLYEPDAFGRLPFWQAAVDGMKERPLWGIGIGRFTSTPYVIERRGRNANSHNDWLQIGSELGLVGLTTWLGLLGTWYLGVRNLSRIRSPDVPSWPFHAIAAGVTGYILVGMAGHSLIYAEQQLIFMSALALGARECEPDTHSKQAWILGVLCLLILLSLIVRSPLPIFNG